MKYTNSYGDTHIYGGVEDCVVDHGLGAVHVRITTHDGGLTEVHLDAKDLRKLNRARKELKQGPSEPDPGAVLSILAASRSTDRFVYDRVEYRHDNTSGEWVAWGRVDTEGDDRIDWSVV